ncbi:MAG: zinc/manganese transporter permease [Gammaproteobacteria bacterium]|nr:MAG: zinc/manganese transporter permease [Gammaproteobacteria bacterium]
MIWGNLDLMLIVPALLAGTIVLSIHVPLGQEVLKRGIIFIDIAIAQVAALGVIIATVFGGELSTWKVQVFAGLSALLGAVLIRYLERHYQSALEALIGLVFVLAASGGILLASYAPHSAELLHDLLVGQILWVNYEQLLWVSLLYLPLLLALFLLNNSQRPWLFYFIFSLAVTASVQLVGIYLVFASLILPALVSRGIKKRSHQLGLAYLTGLIGYILGIIASLSFDLPTGAITVWTLLISSLLVKLLLNRTAFKILLK